MAIVAGVVRLHTRVPDTGHAVLCPLKGLLLPIPRFFREKQTWFGSKKTLFILVVIQH